MSSSTWSTSGPTIASTSSFRGPGCASHSSAPPEIALALHNSCRKSSQNPKGTGAPLTFILKHMHNLSDEALCERWVENPYFQYFCGEVAFRHELPFDRSSLTRWRQRLGEEQIVALLQESLSVAHRTGAIDTKDLERVAIDTTVQEKAIAHPTDARLTHRAIEKLVELAKREGVELRQSYLRLA